jgi:tetratricopeptide (TPR) repeat protein
VSWDPQTEKLAVKVTEGRVEVSGDGQPLQVLAAGASLELSAAARVSSTFVPPVPSTEASRAPEAQAEPTAPRKAVAHAPDFLELSTAGRYREALAAIEQLGFAGQCASLSARDLLTLGSTARLAGRPERAQEAYAAVRRRFPRCPQAGISAFSLGRLASDAGRATDAIGWFQRYLSEAPSGPLAREAEGRLIELFRQSGNLVQARSAAQRYLEKYPTGPHAALAESMLTAR